jgi:hypothetical protein
MFGPVRNQGARPTCLAFAASDAHAALRPRWTPLSCEFAFFHAQRRAGRVPAQGALLSAVLETLREDGQPEEAGWPYLAQVPTDVTTWAPPTSVGEVFTRDGMTTSSAIKGVVQELDGGRPVILLLQLSAAFFRPGRDGVVDPAPGEAPERDRWNNKSTCRPLYVPRGDPYGGGRAELTFAWARSRCVATASGDLLTPASRCDRVYGGRRPRLAAMRGVPQVAVVIQTNDACLPHRREHRGSFP